MVPHVRPNTDSTHSAPAATLQGKHALELEGAQLKRRMGRTEVELNLAEAEEQLKVLENFESGSQTKPALFQPQPQSGGMIDYLKYYRGKSDVSVCSEPSPVKFTGIGTATDDPDDLEPLTPNHLLVNTSPLTARTVPQRRPVFTGKVEAGPTLCRLVFSGQLLLDELTEAINTSEWQTDTNMHSWSCRDSVRSHHMDCGLD